MKAIIAHCALSTLLMFVLSGCAPTTKIGQITTGSDKFRDFDMEIVKISTGGKILRQTDRGKPHCYYLLFGAHSVNHAERADELVFLLDGAKMQLTGDYKITDTTPQGTLGGQWYYNEAIFPITGEEIRRLVDASKVELAFYGPEIAQNSGTFAPKTKQAIAKFYRLFVQGEWDRMGEQERAAASKAAIE